ncbi:hypothetical protein BH23CHL2_BH23CHL2_35400 [soil metagenome]
MAVSPEFRRTYRHGALVIWPPVDVRSTVNALRKRYDPASQAICDAHITLTQPFLDAPGDEDLKAISAVVAGHLPVRIRYGPLGTFLPYPCVYLEIQPAGRLRELQRALYALDLFNLANPFSDPDEYIFHMSITDGYPDEQQTAQILDALRGSEPLGEFVTEQVAWIRPHEEFHFEVVQELPVASAARLVGRAPEIP